MKIDIILGAYDRMRISGITVNPGARENVIALRRLERMAARWQSKNICVGYNFEDQPDLNSDSNVPEEFRDAFESNLAFWLCTDYGKQPSQTLVLEQQSTLSQISSATAIVTRIKHPTRQPIGSGNTLRYNRYQKYYRPPVDAPVSCATNKMNIGDVNDFTEHFESYLNGTEVISSYTIEVDDGLTIVSDSLTSPDINYRIEAVGGVTAFLQVKIVATTDTGRIETRIINFELTQV